MESELLARLSEQQRAFLTRTAVLERMCGPLCEAVLELPGSAAMLAELARSNLLLVPLDRRGQWYRYHHLFRDMLLDRLERQAPGLISVLRRRAAAWCLRNDLAEEALEYSIVAGDVDTAAALVEQLWLRTYQQARMTTVQRWFAWLEDRARSRSGQWSLSTPRSMPVQQGGRLRLSGGLMRSVAGGTGTRTGPTKTHTPRGGPRSSGLASAGTGSSRSLCRDWRGSYAVTSTAATPSSRTPSASPLVCAVRARIACTAETSQRHAGNSSTASGCGICWATRRHA